MDLDVAGDAALVTVSSSDLGRASAAALAEAGANVVVNGRDGDRLTETVEDLRELDGGEVVGRPADVTDPDEVTALVEATDEEFGGLDHLVTSAGGPPSGPFLETDEDE